MAGRVGGKTDERGGGCRLCGGFAVRPVRCVIPTEAGEAGKRSSAPQLLYPFPANGHRSSLYGSRASLASGCFRRAETTFPMAESTDPTAESTCRGAKINSRCAPPVIPAAHLFCLRASSTCHPTRSPHRIAQDHCRQVKSICEYLNVHHASSDTGGSIVFYRIGLSY